jgi:BirA family transcriptional regulator, biotin operon repressor / biotin---[acetyl-CoA-carboxylase] ligase
MALPAPFDLIDLDIVGSTNDEAAQLAVAGAPAWTVVRARNQTAGRGRSGKSFASSAGNSYTSFILRPQGGPGQAAQLALVSGLAVAEAIDIVAPRLASARCKWPNDVHVERHKVSGILVEAASSGDRVEHVIIGIGINLVSHPDLPGLRIGDLAGLGAPGIGRDCMLAALADRLHARCELWGRGGFAALREAWLARAAGLGRTVRIEDGPRRLSGALVDIDADGALVLESPDRTRQRVVSGSLFLEDAA